MPDDPLEAVREAERLVREATERAEKLAGEVPPRGFEPPGARRRRAPAFPDLSALTSACSSSRAARSRPTSSASSRRRCASC